MGNLGEEAPIPAGGWGKRVQSPLHTGCKCAALRSPAEHGEPPGVTSHAPTRAVALGGASLAVRRRRVWE